MELHLKDKIVLVSGSAHGLGKSIARSFLSEGAIVVIADIDRSRIDQTTHEFSNDFESSKFDYYEGDLTKLADIKKCVDFVIRKFSRIDICIANMGSGSGISGWEIADNEWERMMSINFDGSRRLANAVIQGMINNNSGTLIFISSIAGVEVIGAPVQYSVAKASILAYAKNLSRLVGRYKIRVNVVCPGNIYFEDGTWDKKLKENKKGVVDMLEKNVPLNRFASPEEIADLVLFLSSERASFITGSCIIADGGQTISI